MKPALPLALLLLSTACATADAPQPAPAAAEPGPEPRVESRGERLFHAECGVCHALDPGANTAAAPTLSGIFQKPIASEPGYNYSPALRALSEGNGIWTERLLDLFLADPEATVPGTEMSYSGLADVETRRSLIAWLRDR